MIINTINLYLRNYYYKLLLLFLFLIYVVRYITITVYPESYIFLSFDELNLERLNSNLFSPLFYLFILFLFVLGKIIPEKTIMILPSRNRFKFIVYIYILLNSIEIISLLFSGHSMGTESNSILEKIAYSLTNSLITPEILLFIIIILYKNYNVNIVFLVILYIIPTLIVGSKSGLIYLLLFIVSDNLIKKNSIPKKIYIFGIVLIILFPFYSIYSYYVRLGGSDFIEFVIGNIDYISSQDYGLILSNSLSRRLSAIDVLSVPNISSDFMNTYSYFIYILKGIIPAGFVDIFVNHIPYSVGRVFAVDILGQSSNIVSGYETTFYGLILFSKNQASSFILLFTFIYSLFFVLNRLVKTNIWYLQLIYAYFIFNINFLLMTGSIQALAFNIRILIVMIIVMFIYNKLPRKKLC